MIQHKNKHSSTRPIWLVVLGLLGLGSIITILLIGADIRLFNPKGAIAEQQLWLLVFTLLLTLTIAVPTLIVLYSFAWKYRESNTKAGYDPKAEGGRFSVTSMWAVPTIFMIILGIVMWPATHRLEPKKALDTDAKPMTIKVVAMRWKWLFIYPDQNIATVNYVHVPVGTPVQFELTADEVPMSSFWIPHLGGQLYAMTGHVTKLNLIADEAGEYPGSSAEINGPGFAGMKFVTKASPNKQFDEWVQSVKATNSVLDDASYKQLLKPSENHPVESFGATVPEVYDKLLTKYTGSNQNKIEQHEGAH